MQITRGTVAAATMLVLSTGCGAAETADRALDRQPGAAPVAQLTASRPVGELSGTIQSYDVARGFGTLATDGRAPVVMSFSQTELLGSGSVTGGQRVTFDLVQGRRGAYAVHVTPTT